MSILIEISGDIWYQLGLQRTSSDNVVLLLTDITPIVRQNRQFRHLLDVPMTEFGRGSTLERLLSFMQAKALIRDDAFLEVANWREQLKKTGWLRRRVRHGKGRVLDVQANTLPDGGFLVELKDVTLESRATEK
jgi:hypothetical protein